MVSDENGPVLVTGARGFIGRNVAKAYSEQGVEVIGVGHGHWTEAESRRWGLSVWREDDVTIRALSDLHRAPSIIVHCAGGASVGRSVDAPHDAYQRTVGSTQEVLEFTRCYAPGARLVFLSSASVYGSTGETRAVEEQLPNPQSPYGWHKSIAEQLCLCYAMTFGVRISIVRLFSVYGPGLRKQLLWDACRKLCRGDPAFGGSGHETRDWVHVADAAALLILAGQATSSGCIVVNGGTGTPVSVRSIVIELAEALRSGRPVTFDGSTRPGDPEHLVADPRFAASLGWAPRVKWQDGVREYAAWFTAESA